MQMMAPQSQDICIKMAEMVQRLFSLKLNNGGHTEPSISERYSSIWLSIVGNQNGDIEMANEVWDFFKTKTR